jgi:hypothetical protein
MNFDIFIHYGNPFSPGWRRKGEWRWQRPS